MTTLDEVRERAGERVNTVMAAHDRRFLLAELDALKSALQLAKPAIEAGANCIHTFMIHTNDVEVPTVHFRVNGMKYEDQLRALAEIVK